MKRLIILFFITITTIFADIGKVTAINGSATIIRDGASIPIQKNISIEEKDIIKTMKNSKLQIIFKDETVISLGQKTTFEIQEYLFSQTKPKARFNISKGLFKSITGKIGHIAPKNFKLKTQNATIGVRGTTIIGETSKDVDTIICSSGKIVVSSLRDEVAVNMGERTIVRRGHKPTPAVKISTNMIRTIDRKVIPVKKQLTKSEQVNQKPMRKKEVFEKERIVEVSDIKDKWGDWNKKDIVTEDLKKEPKPPVKEQEKPKMLEELQALRDRAGTANPTYSGKVSGFVDTPMNKISDKNNHINLDFDLGRGTMSGDMGFEAKNQTFSSQIKDGTIDKRGQFDFGLENQKDMLSGSGDGMLSGKHLENADGTFRLKNKITNSEAFGTFHADKK